MNSLKNGYFKMIMNYFISMAMWPIMLATRVNSYLCVPLYS